MRDITRECYFRPRVYKDKLSVNIFYHDIYLGSIRNEGKLIDVENGNKRVGHMDIEIANVRGEFCVKAKV